jgi:hypothetical protein
MHSRDAPAESSFRARYEDSAPAPEVSGYAAPTTSLRRPERPPDLDGPVPTGLGAGAAGGLHARW